LSHILILIAAPHTGLYCRFVSELIAALILKSVPNVRTEDVTIPDAPEADETSIRFFVHPPSDLEEMRAEVEANPFKA